ncbi:MAG TPA: NAD(P)-dependent oxidoreductase [Candidatus Eremiobacteraceae bacterium]|nr:NAD(P)-dependent oxidoreductase [Candidatus Eremiobacteraceae bacterium]
MAAAKSVGLVGAGSMGEPMGAALLRAGFGLHVCAHVNRRGVDALVAQGAHEDPDPAGVARHSDVVITMVPDAPQVEEAIFGANGIAAGLPDDGAVIDMSTISPVASRAFHQRLEARKFHMLDAPVSGGPARARSGDLAIMAGGDAAVYARCEAVLQAMGKPAHVGPAGMGETFKLVNQIIIANVMIADVEALVFAKKAGADIEKLRQVISAATGSNYLLEKWLPTAWLKDRHHGGFALDLLRKDLNAALDAAKQMGVPVPASALANQLYATASAEGHGKQDYSAVAQLYERSAGVQVAADVPAVKE